MIYTDGSKLVGDTREELTAYAKGRQMSQHWFLNKGDRGWYEIFGNLRKLIMRDVGVNVQYVTKEKLLEISMKMMLNPGPRPPVEFPDDMGDNYPSK